MKIPKSLVLLYLSFCILIQKTKPQNQNYQYAQDAGHLAVSSANSSSPQVHMMPIPQNRLNNSQNPFLRRSGTPILVNNLTGLQNQKATMQNYMPEKFSFDPQKKIKIDSQPRELARSVKINPPTQSPLLNGINNMNSAVQMPLNLSMVIGKAVKKQKDAKKKKKKLRRKQRELRKTQEVRNLLGFQKNFPFSNKYFGENHPKFVPDAMYFNPVSHDIGGLPKLDVDMNKTGVRFGPYMEENPDMSVEGQSALSTYETNSATLVDMQNYFDEALTKMGDLKSSINRNEQEMGDILKDIKSLK